MFTTGSKLLFGASGASLVGTLLYGILVGGIMGTVGLVSLTTGLIFIAGINAFIRDANVASDDVSQFSGSAAAAPRPSSSVWPLVVAVGGALIALGVVIHEVLTITGLVVVLAASAEWLLQGWAESASSDELHNREVRGRLAYTAEMPVAAAIGLGLIVFMFSRVMLGVPTKASTIIAFSIVATIVLIAGAMISRARSMSAPRMFGLFAVVSAVLLAGGAVAGFNGEREIKEHKTTAYYAELDKCGEKEISADEHASQTVAGKANSSAEVTLDENGLSYTRPGLNMVQSGVIQLPRSNANNILFRNETSEPRRFIAEMANVDGSPARICTALVEEGGVQLLTVNYSAPSFDPVVEESGGYAFVVAGLDDRIEVIVP